MSAALAYKKPPCVKNVLQTYLNTIHTLNVLAIVLEVTRMISRFQDASSGANELHELKSRSRELQNSLSLAAAEELTCNFTVVLAMV